MHEANWENEGGLLDENDRQSQRAELESRYQELKGQADRLTEEQAERFKDNSAVVPVVLQNAPSETELVIVSLLMRIYDVQMALLSNIDKTTADEIFDAHSKGGTFNPPIFIPNVTTEEPT